MAMCPVVLLYVIYFIIFITPNTNASLEKYRAVNYQRAILNKDLNHFRQNKVEIKVYYESLCPASSDFFTNDLQPTVEALGFYMKVILIPYGNAETRKFQSSYRFSCQHGPRECYGNRLHACAIDFIKNDTKAVFYISCLMKYSVNKEDFSVDFTAALNWCGHKYKVPIRQVWSCARSKRGTNLLKYFGEETHKRDIKYVPYVMLDDSSDMQDQATAHLMATICQMLEYPPPICEIFIHTHRRRLL